MLLIEGVSFKFVVMRNLASDLDLFEQLEDLLGWKPEDINLLASARFVVKHNEKSWTTRPFRAALGKSASEEVERRAYQVTDQMLSMISSPLIKQALQTCYHEVASNWSQMMTVFVASSKSPCTVALVDPDFYEAFRRTIGRFGRSRVHHLVVGWGKRKAPVFTRERQRFIVNQFLARHPLIVRRVTLIGSLWRNDKRAKNFKKRSRLRFSRWVQRVRAFGPGDIGKLFESGTERIAARLTRIQQALGRWGRQLQERAGLVAESNRSLFSDLQWRIGSLFASSETTAEFQELEAVPDLEDNRIVLITVSDSGSRVNLDPALEVSAALKRRGMGVLLATDSGWFANKIETRGLPVVHVGIYDENVRREKIRWPIRTLFKGQPVLSSAMRKLLEMNWPYYMRRQRHLGLLFDKIAARADVQAVFSINETLPLAVAFGNKAIENQIPWVGHFPILVGRRPDGYFFPAPYHLAYGDQIRDHMVQTGKVANTIKVVGAFTYDKHHGRDRDADRQRVEHDFPRTKGKKLVMVGTEAFPDPETELDPVLSAAPFLDGVHVILKLHPSDELSVFEAMAERLGIRDRIDIVKQYPLGQLLGASDLLIVVVSNIAIEAAIIGTPTLICDFSGKADVVDFVSEGLSLGCNSPERVGEMVRSMLFDEATAIRARELLEQGIRRFNGPNDGHSSERIADILAGSGPEGRAGGRLEVASLSGAAI